MFILLVLCICCSSAFAVRNSTGTSFAVAFSAMRSYSITGECLIYISAMQSTDITVSSDFEDSTHTVNARDTLKLSYSCATYRLEEGFENKVLYITATDEVSVALSNIRSDDYMDMLLALPRYDGTNEYNIMSHATSDTGACNDFTSFSFYNILAYEDNTQVTILQLDNSNTTITLNLYQAYTVRAYAGSEDLDFTGVKVTAEKAVSVTSGNACSDLHDSDNDLIWASMPTSVELGTTYISPAIYHYDWHSYTLRVLALTDTTAVSFQYSDYDTVINRGEFAELIVSLEIAEIITCSQPCQVAQYGSSSSIAFMTVLPSTNHYVKSAQFTNSNNDMYKFAYVILLSDDVAGSGITIDGGDFDRVESFGEYTWLAHSWSDSLDSDEWHIIESEVPFSVLMYGLHSISENRGYGYNAAFTSTVPEPTTSPTSTTPDTPDTQPMYEISMTGEFYSSTGEDFSQQCAVDYGVAMNDRALQRIPQVNSVIGSDLCAQHTTAEMSLTFAATSFFTDSNTGQTMLKFVMEIDSTLLSPSMVEACAGEIGTYLMDHSNWPNPILSPIPGCPEVIFTSAFFNDSGSVWICDANYRSGENALASTPRLSLEHSGLFSTQDGSDITFDCFVGYDDNFQSSTFAQFENVNAMIVGGQMCSDNGGLGLVSTTSNFISQDDVGTTFQDYLFLPGSNTTSTQLYSCVGEVSAYLRPHSNWPPPIIESPAGCPTLVFNPEYFTEDGQKWICV